MSDVLDKSERTIVTDGKVIYMQVLIQQYMTPRYVKPLKHRCRYNSDSSLVCVLIDPLTYRFFFQINFMLIYFMHNTIHTV